MKLFKSISSALLCLIVMAGWCGAQCISNEIGLHADTVIWSDSTHIRAVYTWGSSDQLGDWTATVGTTLSIVGGVLTITGGTGNVYGARWNKHVAATSIRAYVSCASGYLTAYSAISPTYNGATYLANPAIGAAWSTGAAELHWVKNGVDSPVSISALGTSPVWVAFTTDADTARIGGLATAYSNALDTSATMLIGTAFGTTVTVDSLIIDGIITKTSPCEPAHYALTVAAGANGTVDPSGVFSVDSGAGTSIEAVPASGYDFLVWRVTAGTAHFADSTDITTACTLSTNATVTAYFVRHHFLSTILRYGNIIHRWSSRVENELLVDEVGTNNGEIADGIVQDDSGIQNLIMDYSDGALIDLDGGINCGDVAFLNDTTKKFTIMGISRINNKLVAGHSFVNRYDGVGDGFKIYIGSDGVFSFASAIGANSATAQFNATEGRFPSNKEVFWALVFNPAGATNAEKVRFFAYGQEKSLTYTGTFTRIPVSATAPFRIGHDEYSMGFDGTQDEIIIVDSAISILGLQLISVAARNTEFLGFLGQSNIIAWNNQAPNVVADDNSSVLNESGGVFSVIPLSLQTAARSMAPSLCHNLSVALDSGICAINCAVGGTPLCGDDGGAWVYRNPILHDDITTLYGRALQMIRSCVDPIIGFVWAGGESDAEAGRTRGEIQAAIVTLHNNLKEDLNMPNLPMYYRVMGRYETVNPSYTLGEVRLGQVAAASDAEHRYIAVNGIEDGLLESWHITTDAYDRNGMLIAECIKNQRGITTDFGFPIIAIRGDTIIVTRTLGTDITPASGYTGIAGRTGSGTWIEPESVTKSGDTLFLAFSETVYGYRYGYDNTFDTLGIIRDNSAFALPALPHAANDTGELLTRPVLSSVYCWVLRDSSGRSVVRRSDTVTVFGSNLGTLGDSTRLRIKHPLGVNYLPFQVLAVWDDSLHAIVHPTVNRGVYDLYYRDGTTMIESALSLALRVKIPFIGAR
jgi:hypothetical protein